MQTRSADKNCNLAVSIPCPLRCRRGYVEAGSLKAATSATLRMTAVEARAKSANLGSSSFITDATGYAVQHLQYLPFGELFVDQTPPHNDFETRYKFSGKELDPETNYSYFGARYYDSDLSVWLSVDLMSDKYPGISPYSFCSNRPVVYCDPNGLYPWPMVVGIYAHLALYKEMNMKRDVSGGVWRGEYYINRSNRADLLFFGNNMMGSVWELKPKSYSSGAGLMSAELQIERYISAARQSPSTENYIWSSGTTNGTPLPFNGTLVSTWQNYTFKFTIGDAKKGLIFYEYERNNPLEEPVSMPQSQPENQNQPLLFLDPISDDRYAPDPIPIVPIAAVSIPEVVGSFVGRMLCPILVIPVFLEQEKDPLGPTQIEM